MKFWLLLCVFVMSSHALAQTVAQNSPESWKWNVYVLNIELRYERDQEQQTVDRRPRNFALGARKGLSTFMMESSAFSETTGNATLSIQRKHQEYTLWWKQNMAGWEVGDLYLTGGLGFYQEKVVTHLGASSATDESNKMLLAGAGVGLQSLWLQHVIFALEARAFAGKNLDPNPQPSLLARVGFEF